MSFIVLYVTHENEKEARKISDLLLQQKYIACANIFPIQSIYPWKGKIEDSHEVVSLLKTTHAQWKTVESIIEKMHPYEIPCIMKMEVEANKSYENWIQENVNP